jgi:hypothetical protein
LATTIVPWSFERPLYGGHSEGLTGGFWPETGASRIPIGANTANAQWATYSEKIINNDYRCSSRKTVSSHAIEKAAGTHAGKLEGSVMAKAKNPLGLAPK